MILMTVDGDTLESWVTDATNAVTDESLRSSRAQRENTNSWRPKKSKNTFVSCGSEYGPRCLRNSLHRARTRRKALSASPVEQESMPMHASQISTNGSSRSVMKRSAFFFSLYLISF